MDKNLQLKLLANIPIPFKDICFIYTLLVKEIISIGVDEYETMMSNLIVEPSQIFKDSETLKDITTFDIIVYNILKSEDIKYCEYILNAIKTFVKEEVTFVVTKEEAYFSIGNNSEELKFLGRNDYEDFKELIIKTNRISKEQKEIYKAAGSKSQYIIDKIKKRDAAIAKQKEESEGIMSLADIISTVAARSNNINILDIMNINIFQLYDQLYRLQMIEEYESDVKSLLAGCDPDKIHPKYYLRPGKDSI